MIWYDIFANSNWVGTRWQQYSTHLHTDNTQHNTMKQNTQNGIYTTTPTIIIHKYNNTYLLTPWCRVLLENLTGLQLVKKFLAFHGTQRFITALTSVCQLSLSWANPIQSIYPQPTSCRSILTLSTHLRLGLPSDLFPSRFPTKIRVYNLEN